jgi:hypothetical protein
MSKKNKRSDNDELKTTKYPLPFPEVNNMDDVGYYPDDLLADKISRLESERARLVDMKYDPHSWEVELAYLHREKQIRDTRSQRHESYMRDLMLKGTDEDYATKTEFGPITRSSGSNNKFLN